MKKLLFIFLCLGCLFLSIGCAEQKEQPEEPKFLTVTEGVDALKESKNYRVELEIKTLVGEEVEENAALKIEIDGDIQKIQITAESVSYSFYMVNEKDEIGEAQPAIIFNPSILGADYNGYVKATAQEITELFMGFGPSSPAPVDEVVEEEPDMNAEIERIMNAFKEFIDFFANPKDEYFTLDENDFYVFNETGEQAAHEAIMKLEDALMEGSDVTERVDIDVVVKAKTNKEHLTDIRIDLIGENVDTKEPETIRTIALFDRFGEVELNIPSDTITLLEFMEIMQNSGGAETE